MEDITINKIILNMHFSSQLEEKLFTYFERKDVDFNKLAEEAYLGKIPNLNLCQRSPFTRLAIVLYKLQEIRQRFIERNIPLPIFYDTISDIKLRQVKYYQKTNKFGISKDDVIWFRHIFNFCIFKIGSLQFQIFNMIYLDNFMNFSLSQKEKLKPDAPVINVHIQIGANLSEDKVSESFKKATAFFYKYFPEHKFRAFICYSWLLYSGNKLLLPSDSKILSFANRFEIISEINDNEQALDYIFQGKSLHNFPVKTTLQKNAISNLNALGYACGVIYNN